MKRRGNKSRSTGGSQRDRNSLRRLASLYAKLVMVKCRSCRLVNFRVPRGEFTTTATVKFEIIAVSPSTSQKFSTKFENNKAVRSR